MLMTARRMMRKRGLQDGFRADSIMDASLFAPCMMALAGKVPILPPVSNTHMNTLNRRHFLHSTAAAGLGLTALGMPRARAASPNGKLRVLSHRRGRHHRRAPTASRSPRIRRWKSPDSAMWTRTTLAQAAKDHPNAFTCRDYREAFAKHGDKFDAVIVSTPDHSHAPIMLTAMANDKHVYGQKPLVHQLGGTGDDGTSASPRSRDLVTQFGNQRMASAGRRAAVEILRSGLLGKAIEAHAWIGSPNDRDVFQSRQQASRSRVPAARQSRLEPVARPCADMPYRDRIAPVRLALVVGLSAPTASAIGAATCSM